MNNKVTCIHELYLLYSNPDYSELITEFRMLPNEVLYYERNYKLLLLIETILCMISNTIPIDIINIFISLL